MRLSGNHQIIAFLNARVFVRQLLIPTRKGCAYTQPFQEREKLYFEGVLRSVWSLRSVSYEIY